MCSCRQLEQSSETCFEFIQRFGRDIGKDKKDKELMKRALNAVQNINDTVKKFKMIVEARDQRYESLQEK